MARLPPCLLCEESTLQRSPCPPPPSCLLLPPPAIPTPGTGHVPVSLSPRGPSSTADPINTCKIWGLGLCVIVSGVNLLWHLLGAKLRPHVLLLRLPFRHGRAWLGMPSSSPPAYDALLPLTALGTAFIESKRAKANSQPYLTIYLIVNNARAP